MERIFLGLGSNQGDSLSILRSAVAELAKHLDSVKSSSIWKSAPRYLVDQPPFLNLVVAAYGSIDPYELLSLTSGIEAKFGRDRNREVPKGPRSLDIDILLVGARQLESPVLTLPHPGIEERKFVMLPLLELDRDFIHPTSGRSLVSLLQELPPQGIYLLSPPDYSLILI